MVLEVGEVEALLRLHHICILIADGMVVYLVVGSVPCLLVGQADARVVHGKVTLLQL